GSRGPWWSAEAKIVAGATGRVSLRGNGEIDWAPGTRVTGTWFASGAPRRGTVAALQLRGDPVVQPATGRAGAIRSTMRELSGDSDEGWLLSGMTLGLDQGLGEGAQATMRESGLNHLTAVSGANCAVLLLSVNWLLGWMRLPPMVRVPVMLAVLVGFVLVVGNQPSVLRAAFMAGLALLASLIGGRRAAAHVLQMSVVLLLLIDPWLAFSIGFALSIAATAGLIALLDRGILAATLAAQVATFPILIAVGSAVGLRTVVANVLVSPAAMVTPMLGLISLAAEWLDGRGEPFAAMGRGTCALILWVARWDSLPNLSWLPGLSGVLLAAVISGLLLRYGRGRLALLTTVLVGGAWLGIGATDPWPPKDWWLVACDVGQGDGLVIRTTGGVVVVDTGPDPVAIDGCLDRLGVRTVDLLVLTHFHADHVDGVRGVVQGRRIGQVWTSPCQEPAEQFAAAMAQVHDLPIRVPVPGETYLLGDSRLDVVWPKRIIDAGSVPNNASVSFMLTSPAGRVALLADIEPEAQAQMLASADLRADVVKVPHHGSAQFLPALPGAVGATIALISVGAGNTFGHPSPEAVSGWQQAGAQVFTTEQNGDIAVTGGRQVVVRGVSRPPIR
nr:ComEC/Rec2 family competence protein [Candidatus Nanopelagicales bacterium]